MIYRRLHLQEMISFWYSLQKSHNKLSLVPQCISGLLCWVSSGKHESVFAHCGDSKIIAKCPAVSAEHHRGYGNFFSNPEKAYSINLQTVKIAEKWKGNLIFRDEYLPLVLLLKLWCLDNMGWER